MKNLIWNAALPVLFMLGYANLAHAGFIGREVSAQYALPTVDTTYPNATATPPSFFVTDPGVETVVNVENVTNISVDFTDQSLLIRFDTILQNPTWNSASFNGLLFKLISGSPFSLVSGTVDESSTLSGFDASRISFSDTQLALNWNGLSYVNGTTLRIDFESAQDVPEPATLALLGLGLLGFAASRRKLAKSRNA
jgi:hypothetical protein